MGFMDTCMCAYMNEWCVFTIIMSRVHKNYALVMYLSMKNIAWVLLIGRLKPCSLIASHLLVIATKVRALIDHKILYAKLDMFVMSVPPPILYFFKLLGRKISKTKYQKPVLSTIN